MFQLGGAGIQVIVAWFGTFLVNVILAQAAFQMALSCRTPEEGQKGLKMAAIFGVPFVLLGVLFGISEAIVIPDTTLGLIALRQYLMHVLPAPLVGLFFLGIWACALSWGAPCQFSGATSLGTDVGEVINPQTTLGQLVIYTKRSLVLLTLLMIGFGLLRTEQAAWWNILAWTMRNSATFAPVVAVLFWRLATKEAVVGSMILGFLSGILWYHLGGWASNEFYYNIHPVWIGMSANLSTLTIITLLQRARTLEVKFTPVSRKGLYALIAGAFLSIGLVTNDQVIYDDGLLGIFLFSILLCLFVATIIFIPSIKDELEEEKLARAKLVGGTSGWR